MACDKICLKRCSYAPEKIFLDVYEYDYASKKYDDLIDKKIDLEESLTVYNDFISKGKCLTNRELKLSIDVYNGNKNDKDEDKSRKRDKGNKKDKKDGEEADNREKQEAAWKALTIDAHSKEDYTAILDNHYNKKEVLSETIEIDSDGKVVNDISLDKELTNFIISMDAEFDFFFHNDLLYVVNKKVLKEQREKTFDEALHLVNESILKKRMQSFLLDDIVAKSYGIDSGEEYSFKVPWSERSLVLDLKETKEKKDDKKSDLEHSELKERFLSIPMREKATFYEKKHDKMIVYSVKKIVYDMSKKIRREQASSSLQFFLDALLNSANVVYTEKIESMIND